MNYIGIDLGTKTLGIATSSGIIATSRPTYYFKENDFDDATNYLLKFIAKEKVGIIVIGYPKNMNNTLGPKVKMVEDFINLLNYKSSKKLNIVFFDERLTTRMANSIFLEANLSRKKRKSKKDSLSAKIILKMYLDSLKYYNR